MSKLNTELVEAALRAFAEHGLTADIPTEGKLRVRAGERGQRTYQAEVRTRVFPELATAIASPTGRNPMLVIACHIPDSAARVLRERGIDYVDAAGNLRLSWPRLLIEVGGRRPPQPLWRLPAGTSTAGRALTAAGTKVTFALLAWPEVASWPVRDVAQLAGVSLGTAHAAIGDLAHSGYLYGAPSRKRLARGGELLSRWAEAYTTTLAPRLILGRYRAPDPEWWHAARAELAEAGVLLGGEAAASILDPHLRPGTLTLYTEGTYARWLGRFRLRPDEAGDVLLRRRFWHVDSRLEPSADLVPVPLIYGDLLASGDPRQRQQADRMRERDDRLIQLDRS